MERTEKIVAIENEYISGVFGQYDSNIKKIEKAFGVAVVNRGDIVKISGDAKSADNAVKVINGLIDIAKKKEDITEQNLQYLIDLSAEEKIGEVGKIYDDVICLTTNGRPLRPKTLGQKIMK